MCIRQGTKGLPISHNPEAQKATPSVCERRKGKKRKEKKETLSASLWLGWLTPVLQVNLQTGMSLQCKHEKIKLTQISLLKGKNATLRIMRKHPHARIIGVTLK